MNQDSLVRLRKLNFDELIHIDTDDVANYTYETYASNQEHKIKADGIGGCNKCETSNCVTSQSHSLRFMSHGAHTIDYFSGSQTDFTGWSDAPILFILESPGSDGKIYADANKFSKMPTKQWYWVHDNKRFIDVSLEMNTKRKKYGEFFVSIMNHFKLSNVYVTNLVKCGLAVGKKNEYNIYKYDESVVANCFKEYLDKELEIIKPQAVFAFGGRVYNAFRNKYGKDYPADEKLFCMPHPSPRFMSQVGYRKQALTHLLIGLSKSEIITDVEKENHFRLLNLQ
ncbi:hypothetical protein EXU85_23360 [Spirosoma sp. KCTC 42546]|uniref:uracil-DNA glycosylase family protein n=1 Tax=Spirosoma sp. KCTC 42546 TaxID=2520506 RepID=UPI001159E24E|nr:uracil-DNA glycosylase family protein [Spirosoma sp. KCTC 42546]QDK81387.1 hypothetical protein EXU85_23360 [Spirosoma sp. KCTC 42546]